MPSASIAELALAIQSAKGSPAASSTQRTYLSGGSLPGPVKQVVPDTATSASRIAVNPVAWSVPVAGEPEIYVRPKVIGALLYGVLGSKTVSGGGDPYTHVFTLGSTLPYLTFWRSIAGILNERLADVRIARLTIAGRAREPLRCSVSLIGGADAYRTAQETSAAVETADTLLFSHGSGALLVEGVAVSSIRDFVLTIDAGVTLVETLLGPTPMLDGQLSVELAATQVLLDAALWDRMIYATASPSNLQAPSLVPLELAGSPAGIDFTFTLGAAAPTVPYDSATLYDTAALYETAGIGRSLRIQIPRVAVGPIDGWDSVRTQYGPLVHTVHYRAFKPASGSPITATLKNSQPAY